MKAWEVVENGKSVDVRKARTTTLKNRQDAYKYEFPGGPVTPPLCERLAHIEAELQRREDELTVIRVMME